jgi:hypothetical protein
MSMNRYNDQMESIAVGAADRADVIEEAELYAEGSEIA